MKRHPFLRGGKWQRLRTVQAQPSEPGPSSTNRPGGPLHGDPEVDLLLELWALGIISGPTLQQIGKAANAAAPRPQVETLSRLGGEEPIQGLYTGTMCGSLTWIPTLSPGRSLWTSLCGMPPAALQPEWKNPTTSPCRMSSLLVCTKTSCPSL